MLDVSLLCSENYIATVRPSTESDNEFCNETRHEHISKTDNLMFKW